MLADDAAATAHSGNTQDSGESGTSIARADSRLYQLLVATVRDYAIFALDPTGHVISWNAGARRIKGYEEHEIIGRHFSAFYPPEDVAAGKTTWELEIAARDGVFEDEDWRVRKDGTRFWANVVITALRDESGKLVGFAKVTRDLTERRAAETRAIEDARRVAEAEAANRAKTEFLTTMSHELRTPLNAIGGYADLLSLGIGGRLSDDQQQYVDRIRRSQQHLLGIITDLLDYSRIEAGEMTLQLAPVEVGSVLASVMPMIEPQAAERQLTIENRGCLAGTVVRADRSKVRQILANVLSNAVKFTGAGGTISIACVAAAEHVDVVVRDTGIGIPADKLESIFEPFVQLGRTLTTGHEGTGLGLAIGRDLARAMGGDLTVESMPGKGAAFTLRLPAAANPQA